MPFAARFRQGMKAAIPVWIAFVPSSLAWGIAAQAHGLTLEEIVLMSVWVYSGPAQFAVLVQKTLTFDAIFRYMRGAVYGGKPVFCGGNFLPEREPSARIS